MSLDPALMQRARAYNAEQAAARVFSVRVPPTGGRAPLFDRADSPAFAEWVATVQRAAGVRADGALGPSTLRRFRWLVLEALQDGSASHRASAPGWEIFDRVHFPLDGAVTPPSSRSSSSGAPVPSPPPLAPVASGGSSWLVWIGALLVGGAVLWQVTR